MIKEFIMAEKSFLKFYCPVKNVYYGASLEKSGSRWEIVDFIPMKPEEAKPLASLVEQDYFETRKTLLPCQYDNTRRVCSSSRVVCPSTNNYNFQCIYCNKLQISYDNDLSGTSLKEGQTLMLAQGQEVKIAVGGKNIDRIEVNVGWDPARGGPNMDIDSSVVLYSGQTGKYELVYFGNKDDKHFTIHHHGDDLYGDSSQDVDEIVDVNLRDIPSEYDHIAIIINIYDAIERHQNFGKVNNLFMRVLDASNKRALCDYKVTHNIQYDTGIVIGVFSRSGSGWKFKAAGNTSKPNSVHDLAQLAINTYK